MPATKKAKTKKKIIKTKAAKKTVAIKSPKKKTTVSSKESIDHIIYRSHERINVFV